MTGAVELLLGERPPAALRAGRGDVRGPRDPLAERRHGEARERRGRPARRRSRGGRHRAPAEVREDSMTPRVRTLGISLWSRLGLLGRRRCATAARRRRRAGRAPRSPEAASGAWRRPSTRSGVVSTTSGYAGGQEPNPSYDQVAVGRDGARRGRPGRLRSGEGLLREAARGLLEEHRPLRRGRAVLRPRPAVSHRDLLRERGAEAGGAGLEGEHGERRAGCRRRS